MNFAHLGIEELFVVDLGESASIRKAALQSGHHVRSVNLREATCPEGVINELGSALSFPDYFGRNWDAVEECLQDLPWIEGRDVVILVFDADRLLDFECLATISFVRALARASSDWRKRNVKFSVVFVGSKRLFNTADAILRPL